MSSPADFPEIPDGDVEVHSSHSINPAVSVPRSPSAVSYTDISPDAVTVHGAPSSDQYVAAPSTHATVPASISGTPPGSDSRASSAASPAVTSSPLDDVNVPSPSADGRPVSRAHVDSPTSVTSVDHMQGTDGRDFASVGVQTRVVVRKRGTSYFVTVYCTFCR